MLINCLCCQLSRLVLVKFWGVKVINGFSTMQEVGNRNPCVVQWSTIVSLLKDGGLSKGMQTDILKSLQWICEPWRKEEMVQFKDGSLFEDCPHPKPRQARVIGWYMEVTCCLWNATLPASINNWFECVCEKTLACLVSCRQVLQEWLN